MILIITQTSISQEYTVTLTLKQTKLFTQLNLIWYKVTVTGHPVRIELSTLVNDL